MKTDIEIARNTPLKPIYHIADSLEFSEEAPKIQISFFYNKRMPDYIRFV